jgi:hypothetical protein
VGYDIDYGPLLARIYFPQTGVFEVHDKISWFLETYITELRGEQELLTKSYYLRILVRRIRIRLLRHVEHFGSSNKQQLDIHQIITPSPNASSGRWERWQDAKCYNSTAKKNYGRIAEGMQYGC